MKVKVDEAAIRENAAKLALAKLLGIDGFCGNCEMEVTKPDKFCRSCGVELGWEIVETDD